MPGFTTNCRRLFSDAMIASGARDRPQHDTDTPGAPGRPWISPGLAVAGCHRIRRAVERAMPRDRRRKERPSRARPLSTPGLQSAPEFTAGPLLAGRRVAPAREWRWRTFPVFFTFGATLFGAAVLATLSLSVLFLLGVLVLAAGLAHLVTVLVIAPRLKPPSGRRR